jgi:hypothetical protein
MSYGVIAIFEIWRDIIAAYPRAQRQKQSKFHS